MIFIPDKNIGQWAEYRNNRRLIMLDSYCYVHDQILIDDVLNKRKKYPGYSLLVHPECRLEVCMYADKVCSTSQMIDFIKENDEVIIGTETGLYEQMKFRFPQKKLVPLSRKMICDDMKKTDLTGAVQALAEEKYEITVPAETMRKAKKSLDRMFEMLT
ncbi:MAG TPA: hypothetical protein ENL20_02020 [Candidatus Cloacimonetes bacterium]|nr:hypothetical protein [Candidatus Cloacimonadota bacterium]